MKFNFRYEAIFSFDLRSNLVSHRLKSDSEITHSKVAPSKKGLELIFDETFETNEHYFWNFERINHRACVLINFYSASSGSRERERIYFYTEFLRITDAIWLPEVLRVEAPRYPGLWGRCFGNLSPDGVCCRLDKFLRKGGKVTFLYNVLPADITSKNQSPTIRCWLRD